MGLDGGSFPHRSEMVKVKQRDAKADKTTLRRHRFFNCALSGAPLAAPIVACRTGRLYNYEAVLSALLAKRSMPAELRHVQSISDVFAVSFSQNPQHEPNVSDSSPWQCPVTGKGIGVSPERFVVNAKCGCVVAHDLVLHAPDAVACYNCGAQSDELQLVELIVSDEKMDEIQSELLEAQRVRKEERKKAKEAKKKTRQPDDASQTSGPSAKKKTRRQEKVDAPSLVQQAALKAEASTKRVSSLFKPESSIDQLDNSKLFMRVGK
jgi:hypothetical protein